MSDDARALAHLVIDTLDAQRAYSQTKNPDQLNLARKFARELRAAAENVLAGLPERKPPQMATAP